MSLLNHVVSLYSNSGDSLLPCLQINFPTCELSYRSMELADSRIFTLYGPISLPHLPRPVQEVWPMLSINIGSHRAIVLSSYELVRDALKEETFAGRPPFPAFKFRADNKGVIFSTGHNWQEMRRFMLRTFRDFGFGKSSLEIVIQGEIRELIESLKRNVGKPIKLQNTFNLAIINALWTITTGQRFDLEDRKIKPILQLFTKFISEGGSVRFAELVPLIHMVRGISSNFFTFVHEAKSMLMDIIVKHKQEHKEGDVSDFLHVFLDKMEQDERKERSTPFTGEEGRANLLVSTFDIFIAGSETASTTLLWLLLLISIHPGIQDKVQQELDGIVGKERLPSMADKIKQ